MNKYFCYILSLLCFFVSNKAISNELGPIEVIQTNSLSLDQKKDALLKIAEISNEKDAINYIRIIDSCFAQSAIIKPLSDHFNFIKINSFRKLKQFDKAIEVLNSIKPNNDPEFENLIFETYGKIYLVLSNYNAALNYLFKNLNYHTQAKPDIEKQVNTLSNITTCYRRSKLFDKALEYTQRCIQAAETSKQPKLLYIAYSNLGIYYLEIPDLKKADSVYYKLLDFLPALSAKGKISFYNNYAETKRLRKEYAKAKEYIDSCYKLSVIEKDTFWLGIALVNKGNLSIANKNNTQAIKECSLALQYAKKFKSLVWQKNSCECLFEAFEKNNDHKNALIYYKNARTLSDSVLNEKNKNEATQKDFQYKYAIKTAADSIKQIESNKVKDAQIKAQQSQLNEEKIVRISLLIVAVLVLVFAAFTYNRFKSSQKQRAIIEEQKRITDIQKNLLEEKQKEIIDSINYAKRIQQTLLAHDVFLQENIPDLFTLFIPKDIVSGDYYWAIKKNSKFYLAVCDSTGHGVPGAFMSLLNIGFLSEAISERGIEKPNEIFDFVRQRLIENISKEGQRDGFDGILICIDKLTNEMTYAAANNAPVIIHQNQLLTLPSNRMPVGIGEKKDHFDLFSVEMKKGDCLYLYTDGYADQFGGEKGKKFKYKQLNELLISINHLSLPEQKKLLEDAYTSWKGALEQVDDICIIGIRA